MTDSNPLSVNRRDFIKTAAAGAAAFQFAQFPLFGQDAPSNQLKIAGVGLRMGFSNLKNLMGADVVAMADVDSSILSNAAETFPQARLYSTYMEMLDAEDDLDGLVVGTPDHTHAVITMEALRRGLHVYTQKPLTHSIYESRVLTEAAEKSGVIHQMGNQGRSAETIRVLKEWVDDGAIGNITEVHAWTDRPVGGNPWSTFPIVGRPMNEPAIPDTLNWDEWLGPAEYRPYHPIYHPQSWRGFYAFGTGALGDMGCHILDPAFYALDLGAPTAVEGASSHWQEDVEAETYPRASMVRYEFAARGDKPPVTINWTDGRLVPFRPKGLSNDVELPKSGAIFVGDEGVIVHGSHGAGGVRIYPDSLRKAYMPNRPEPYIPRVKGNHETDWLNGIKEGYQPSGSFSYGGPLTEFILLGVLSIRMRNQRLEWDPETLSIPNHEEANKLINPPYREGWDMGTV